MHEDHFSKIFSTQQEGPTKIHDQRETVIFKEFDENAAFEKNETILMDADGPRTIKSRAVHLAGCGHYVGLRSDTEQTGTCEICKTSLCYRCSSTRCFSCMRVTCSSCANLTDDFKVLCKSCARKKIAKSGLKKIHSFFSKAIF